jgi:5-methylcytosine-specific restriction endonuclease McrA
VRLPVLRRDRFTCQYCGTHGARTADHVIPHSKGGTRTLTNLVAACSTCNTSKGDRTLAEWVASGLAPERANDLLKGRLRDGLGS